MLPAQPALSGLDFDQEVIQASHAQPVLVDFWAPWCGPCQVLGPVLERLAAEAGSQWALVKINTDLHPTLSARYHIRGIPAVKLFSGGQVVAEFTGALPEPILRKWLDEHLPSPVKGQVAEARERMRAGDRVGAQALLAEVLADQPTHEEARLLMARLTVFDNPDAAEALIAPLHVPTAESVREVARLLRRDEAALPEAPVRATYLAALAALRMGTFDAALEGFIAVITQQRTYDDDGARKACVALFAVLGESHPVVKTHRPVFNRSLY